MSVVAQWCHGVKTDKKTAKRVGDVSEMSEMSEMSKNWDKYTVLPEMSKNWDKTLFLSEMSKVLNVLVGERCLWVNGVINGVINGVSGDYFWEFLIISKKLMNFAEFLRIDEFLLNLVYYSG